MSERISSMPILNEPERRAAGGGRRRAIVGGVVSIVVLGAFGGWYQFGRKRTAALPQIAPAKTEAPAVVADTFARAPNGVRVRVRVMNGTDVRGLARRATLLLRDLGYDVVDFDGDAKARRERTVILSHTDHANWAQRLQRAMAASAIEVSTDSAHYVDLTVLLGSDWKAPTQPLRP